ncbi:DNA-binding transcriptional regulator, LysR family [Novosphingobium sp. CF614]|uniref:LysR family transcriptional regulator n=1 Tax=Novosphingobium sp. CF614 TaxID=1884364 RepID=UPI0008E4FCBE|nr:LysR family transcriptional regulator [Novosphingobium sp. CF614]SFF96284.1 DNA-binding transcriptional regulator, LysR family [Novosphingobium sp. CF614]
MNLSLVRIQRFVAVAEHLSFTHAATLLGIDQPWLSRQIMQLEDQLGIVLFERSGARIALTPEGQEFYEVAREVEMAAQRVRDKAMEMTRRIRSEMTICVAYATFSLKGRHRLLERFAKIRPDVNIEISASEWTDEVVAKVKSGEADFGIAFGPLDDQNVETCELEALELAMAVPKEHPLAAKSSLHLSDLKDLPVAITIKDPKMIRLAPRYSWLFNAGAEPVHVPEGRRYVLDVAQQRRICVMCYTAADQVPEDFIKLPFADPLPPFMLILVRSKRIMSPSAERLWRLADEMAKEASPKGGPKAK